MELSSTESKAWSVVHTDAGDVTLAPIDSLRARVKQLDEWVQDAVANSVSLHTQSDDHYAAAGAILVPRSKDWRVPAALATTVERACSVVAELRAGDEAAGEAKERGSHGNVFERLGAWRKLRTLNQHRAAETGELRTLLIEVAKSAPPGALPDSETEVRSAVDLEAQAASVDAQIESTKQSVSSVRTELANREQSVKTMGFDALYEAAVLQTSGAAPVGSPLLVKSGETAYVSVAATLARMVTHTQYTGTSSGFSIPIGHTGVRYRVGSYHGQPVQRQALSSLDVGTLVVTNRRIAFIGRTKSTSIALDKILHVEIYTDAVAVFQEHHENPDFYMVAEPRRVIFLLNWILSRQSP